LAVIGNKNRQSKDLLSRFRDSLDPAQGRPCDNAPGFMASE
jgi:hypothetical protein